MDILVVEDDRTNQALLVYQAEDAQLSATITAADNGADALLLLASPGSVALILLDLSMPRMDGFEFLDRLRAIPGHAQTPVIVVTARDLSRTDLARLERRGVQHTLQKGRYDTQDIIDLITEHTQ